MEIGQLFELKYRIVKILGSGGMSTVYLAENINLHAYFAIKEVSKVQNAKVDLLAEPLILTKLKHAAIPKIFDIVENEDNLYIIEEYIEGSTLDRKLVESKRFKEEVVIEWAKAICDLLQYLHSRKPHPIIYRDMKPSNLMLTDEGQVKLVDFGIAREFKKESGSDTTYMGTRGYAAPEQYGASQTDERTDIYGLGVTLYHLVTGKSPNEPPFEIRPVRELDKTLSMGIEHIIGKCTQQDPSKRYQSVSELEKDIERILEFDSEFKRDRARSRMPIALSLVLLISFTALSGFGFVEMEKESIDKYEGTIERGVQLLENHDIDQAMNAFEDAISQKPEIIEAYKEISKLYLSENMYEECRKYIEYGILLNIENASNDSDILYILGTACFELKDYGKAAEYFGFASRLDPQNADYRRDLAVSYARLGETSESESILKDLSADSEKRDTVAYIQGELAYEKGSASDAIEAFEACISATNDESLKRRAYIMEAQIYNKDNAYNEEICVLERAVSNLSKKNDPIIIEMLGEAYFSKGLKDGIGSDLFYETLGKAADSFEILINSGFKRAYIYRNIGVIYHYMEEYEKSESVLKDMAKLFPEDFRSYYELALLYADMENGKTNERRNYGLTFINYELAMQHSDDDEKQSEMQPLINLVEELHNKGWN